MSHRAILFDLDDTLHDKCATLDVVGLDLYRAFGLQGLDIELTEWQADFLKWNRLKISKAEAFQRLSQRFQISSPLTARLLEHFDTHLGRSAIAFPGAIALLEACRAHGLMIGIVTNGRDVFQRSKIAGMGIEPLVDAIVTSGQAGIKKPDPRIFKACLEALNVRAGEATFVGDDLTADVEPALALGMRAVWKSKHVSPLATFSSDSLEEIRLFLLT